MKHPPHPWLRLPGLFHRVEFQDVVEVDSDFFVEEAGQDDEGVAVYRIYFRPHDRGNGGGEPPTGAPAVASCA